MLRSSPKCGKKGFRPEAVLESGLKDLEEVKGLEEDTNLIDRDLLEKQNGTSEDEENTKSSQAVQVFESSDPYSLMLFLTSNFIVTPSLMFIIIFTTFILSFSERYPSSFILFKINFRCLCLCDSNLHHLYPPSQRGEEKKDPFRVVGGKLAFENEVPWQVIIITVIFIMIILKIIIFDIMKIIISSSIFGHQ